MLRSEEDVRSYRDQKQEYATWNLAFHSRGIYVWAFASCLVNDENDRANFFNFCKARGIRTVLLSAEELTEGSRKYDRYKDFIAVAHNSHYDMQVHALFANMSGSWTKNHTEV